jgi:hypothetical protein
MPRKGARFTFEDGGSIESLEHFLEEIRKFGGRGPVQTYFRGQGEAVRELMPSIGRKQSYAGRSVIFTPKEERSLLKRFRRYAYEYFKRVPTEWETLFLARHHGLPTRLLDWTSNPLVALYFAASHENDEAARSARDTGERKLEVDGTVWAIARRQAKDDELDVFADGPSPLDVPGIRIVFPVNPSPRLTAQSGVFTLHGDPWTDLVKCAGKAYSRDQLDIDRLKRWTVPTQNKAAIILDLERVAINSRTLFPDLDGLARGLWETEVLRKAFGKRDGRSN